jgi:hypothetical protein
MIETPLAERARRCPTCDSPNPTLHPSMQPDSGEVQICPNPFHANQPAPAERCPTCGSQARWSFDLGELKWGLGEPKTWVRACPDPWHNPSLANPPINCPKCGKPKPTTLGRCALLTPEIRISYCMCDPAPTSAGGEMQIGKSEIKGDLINDFALAGEAQNKPLACPTCHGEGDTCRDPYHDSPKLAVRGESSKETSVVAGPSTRTAKHSARN